MRLKFDLLVIGFGVLVVAVFGVYGLLYAMTTGNEAIAWWGLVGFVVVGIGAFVLAYFMQRRINKVLAERDGLQQRLDLVLAERDSLQHRLDLVLAERDRLQEKLYQILAERDNLQQRLAYVQLVESLSDKELCVFYLSKRGELTLDGMEQLTGIPDRTISDIKKALRGKGLLP